MVLDKDRTFDEVLSDDLPLSHDVSRRDRRTLHGWMLAVRKDRLQDHISFGPWVTLKWSILPETSTLQPYLWSAETKRASYLG